MSAIQIKTPALAIKAGPRALARIRDHGLSPADVGTIPGAAGGPKALGIQGLDLALFGEWLPRAERERSLIGASIGSWRFASACLPNPVEGIELLGKLYNEQSFAKGVTMAQVTQSCVKMLDDLLQGRDASVLSNPHYRLNIMIVKSHGLLALDHRGSLGLGLGSVIANNLIGAMQFKNEGQATAAYATFAEAGESGDALIFADIDTAIFAASRVENPYLEDAARQGLV